jgi:predicted anti-sigma-YlaC factor YlaD
MFCDEALDAVEAIAAGDLTPDGRIAEHLASCANCAGALDDARHLERSLRARPAPAAPPQFTSRTLARVRRARWRSDQFLDVGFNVAIISLVVALFGGVWMLVHRSGLDAVSSDAANLFGTGFVAMVRRVAPSLPLYAGAAVLLASALGLWWWAERDAAL